MGESSRALAAALQETGPLLTRFLTGFDDGNRTRQGPGLPNHAIWVLGHTAMTMHRAADRIAGGEDQRPLPEADFVMGDGRSGDAGRFDSESVCIGSTPVDEPGLYPPLQRGVEVFEAAITRLAEAIRRVDDDQLGRELAWGASSMTRGALIARIMFHNGVHAGQLADLRRSLGFERVIG